MAALWKRRWATWWAAREPAHGLPGTRWGAAAADPGGIAARPRLVVESGERGELAGGAGERGAARDLICRRAAVAGASVRAGGGRARAAAGAAPHRRRRLVAGAAGARPVRGYAARRHGTGGRSAGAAGAVCRLHAVAARGAGRGERTQERDRAPARRTGRDAQGPARADRAAERPAAAGGGELSRGEPCRSSCRRSCTAACWRWRGRAGEPVHGAAGGAGGAADAAGGGQRHPDRQPDCGAHRQRARRAGRVLRQHAGAAHRHVGQSELPGAGRRGCGRAIWRPTATRTCRSSGWWRCSTRRARCRAIRCSR